MLRRREPSQITLWGARRVCYVWVSSWARRAYREAQKAMPNLQFAPESLDKIEWLPKGFLRSMAMITAKAAVQHKQNIKIATLVSKLYTILEGNAAQRPDVKFVPGGVDETSIPVTGPELKNRFDDLVGVHLC